MLQTLSKQASWRTVLDLTKKELFNSSCSYAYAKHVVRIANQFALKERDVIELALHLGMKVFPRNLLYRNYLGQSSCVVTGLPPDWIAKLSETYLSLCYENPNDQLEVISIVPSGPGSLPHIVHQTSDGHVDPDWFNEVVPTLYAISCADKPPKALRKVFGKQPLTLGQVNTINHFFKKDPILHIAGVCLKCYQVSLPDKGFGVKLLLKTNPANSPAGVIEEIRFSARKHGFSGPTSRPYVTEVVVAGKGMLIEDNGVMRRAYKNERVHTLFDPSKGTYSFTSTLEQENTHIDATLYNFDHLTMRLPVCTCPQ